MCLSFGSTSCTSRLWALQYSACLNLAISAPAVGMLDIAEAPAPMSQAILGPRILNDRAKVDRSARTAARSAAVSEADATGWSSPMKVTSRGAHTEGETTYRSGGASLGRGPATPTNIGP